MNVKRPHLLLLNLLKQGYRNTPQPLRRRIMAAPLIGRLARRLVRIHRASLFRMRRPYGFASFLPVEDAAHPPSLPSPLQPTDVIVPVYKGLEETRTCIESVLRAPCGVPFRLIVINDHSPEPELHHYLRTLRDNPTVLLIENPQNLGFVKTVNIGMGQSPERDVVLLNSDTAVAGNWLDRLVAHAYASEQVGTVTPFSNNATICSYPNFPAGSDLPDGETTESLDRAFAQVNAGRSVELPTAVGFCMFIRRACLDQIGLFDEAAFGRGYGEENDFCLKASARGWRHLLAADTFVYHAGERSFGAESAQAKQAATAVIQERHPNYAALVARHVRRNPAFPMRVAVTAYRYKQSNLPVILLISHSLGGGTQKHIDELERSVRGKARLLLLRRAPDAYKDDMELAVLDAEHPLRVPLRFPEEHDFVLRLLRSFGVSRVHIHHLLGLVGPDIRRLVRELGLPFDFTVHDYYVICPQIFLVDKDNRYCGEPEMDGCTACLGVRPSPGGESILEWRKDNEWLIEEAARVICPSQDVRDRIARYHDTGNFIIVPHEPKGWDDWPELRVPSLQAEEPLRIAILGTLEAHKGSTVVTACAGLAEDQDALLAFHIVGRLRTPRPSRFPPTLVETGDYEEADLPALLKRIDPHVIWFPVQCPETYSYTLTTAINLGIPIVAPRLGAFPERLSGRPWTWLVDFYASPADLVQHFKAIRKTHVAPHVAPAIDGTPTSQDAGAFYPHAYLSAADHGDPGAQIDLRRPGLVVVLAVVDRYDRLISPCGYIRTLLPLTHPTLAGRMRLKVIRPEVVTHYRADLLLVQRIAVTEPAAMDAIFAHARQSGMRIVYDLDDDLLRLPAEHPDWAHYQASRAAVFRFLCQSDIVSVSTAMLKRDLEQFHPKVVMIPNALDERLWNAPLDHPPEKTASRPVRVLFMGTATHRPDLQMISGAVRRLKAEFRHDIEFTLVGLPDRGRGLREYNRLVPPEHVSHSYPDFVHWLRRMGPFDIGIAPLLDSEFNRRKSAIKFLDYAGLGLAAVCSDVEPHRAIVNHGENGLLVSNDEQAWYAALRDLVTDPQLRERLARNASADLCRNHTLEAQAEQRNAWLDQLLSAPVGGGMAATIRDLTADEPATDEAEAAASPSPSVLWTGARDLLAHAFLHGEGIELGALHNPLPVSQAARVTYVDRISREELLQHYPELDPRGLVPVDRVDGDLSTFPAGSQDFVIANHLLEHCEDPIGMLQAFDRVLRPGGVIFMALPDKRYTFDHARESTTLAHVLSDHQHGPEASRFQHYREWAQYVEPNFGRTYASAAAVDRRAHELMDLSYSIHFHNWEPSQVSELLDYCVTDLELQLSIECFLSFREEMIILIRKQAQLPVAVGEAARVSQA